MLHKTEFVFPSSQIGFVIQGVLACVVAIFIALLPLQYLATLLLWVLLLGVFLGVRRQLAQQPVLRSLFVYDQQWSACIDELRVQNVNCHVDYATRWLSRINLHGGDGKHYLFFIIPSMLGTDKYRELLVALKFPVSIRVSKEGRY